jgi:hypothetical protein
MSAQSQRQGHYSECVPLEEFPAQLFGGMVRARITAAPNARRTITGRLWSGNRRRFWKKEAFRSTPWTVTHEAAPHPPG